jgi:hypothetical protein
MLEGPDVGPEVESGSKKSQVLEGTPEFVVRDVQLGVALAVVLV